MQKAIAFIVSLALVVPGTPALAAMIDIFEGDIEAWEEAGSVDAEQEAEWGAETQREGSEELFPSLPLEEKSTLELRREQRTGEFVSVIFAGQEIVLRDVPLKEWYAPYVRAMAERGVVGGYLDEQGRPLGLFKPANNVSVEELAKIAIAMTGGIQESCAVEPKNLSASGSWSKHYVACAEARQWVLYSDGTVDVRRPATRGEVVSTILEAYKQEPAQPTGTVFTDVGISMQFSPVIEQAYADGIIIGYADAQGNALGTFGPNNPVTRAELTKILTLADQVY